MVSCKSVPSPTTARPPARSHMAEVSPSIGGVRPSVRPLTGPVLPRLPSPYDLPWSRRTVMFPRAPPRGMVSTASSSPSSLTARGSKTDQFLRSSYFGQESLPNVKHHRSSHAVFGEGATYRYPRAGLLGIYSRSPGPNAYSHMGSVGLQQSSEMLSAPIISLRLTEDRWASIDSELSQQADMPGPGERHAHGTHV